MTPARILLYSHRNICEPEVWRGAYREFEDIIQEVDAVDLIAPGRASWFRQRKNHALRVGKFSSITVNPGVQRASVKRQYDLMFVICEKPSELLNLAALDGWKDNCKTSVCWLTEFYENDIPAYKSSLDILAKFDRVIFSTVGNSAFRRLLPEKVSYLPPAVDALDFCPYPSPPKRFIDVLSIGRRSEEAHRGLLRMARANELFYVYDTLKDLATYNVEEHRFLFANMAKRSRYFVVNPGKINRPEETGGQSEFGQRYFEGLAPGAILIGERPKNNKEFDRIFDWPDAVISVPFGSENLGATIRELDKEPERQQSIRKRNITESLLKHDWIYRWESVLNLAGLQSGPRLLERKQRLANLTTIVASESMDTGVQVG